MYGYGYGYGGNEWLWIAIVIFIVFFLVCGNNNRGFGCCNHHNSCNN